MTNLNDNRFTRNVGFISAAQQARLAKATVAIAGVGGVGGRIAVELARLGIGALRLADPDIFTVTNLNRQEGSSDKTLGELKVRVIAEMCADINPGIDIKTFDQGIDEDNLDAFTKGADIVIESTDFSLPHLGVMLARAARELAVPLVMGVEIGFGATVCWFKPAGYKYESHLGLKPSVSLADLKSGQDKVDLSRWLPHVPGYGDIKVLQAVAAGKVEAPAIMPAVDICAAITSTLVVGLLVGFQVQPSAPAVFHFDAKERRSRLIRYPLFHHYLSLTAMLLNNLLGIHDKMDTTTASKPRH